jgi:hypothetical protein
MLAIAFCMRMAISLRKQVANDVVTMRHAEYSGAVNVDHDGEKEKGSFEAHYSFKHMHFGLWRAAASSESVVARDVFGPVSGP